VAKIDDRPSRSARIREQLGHPVLDGDGHIVELFPVFADFVRDHAGGAAIKALNPDNIDEELLYTLLTESDPRLARYSAEQLKWQGGMKEPRDDFAAARITSLEDVRNLFCTPFFWGCEADDPLVGLAFDSRITPLGAKVPAFFASDLGHWDVPDFDEPLEEAHGLVERGILSDEELKDFVFTNPVRFYSSLNQDFFVGTSIEGAAVAARRD
jgi:hypothetical protein